jgi:hypothetical protein
MIIRRQDNIRALLAEVAIPRAIRVRQNFRCDSIADVQGTLARMLRGQGLEARIRKGMRVALTAGSRGISGMSLFLREIASFVREQGATPVIIPAMGSHGGSTAEGQREILEGYGITAGFCGCEIHSSMETVQTGSTLDGRPVFVDRFAAESDGIVVVGRIRPHTDFRGRYESGLAKMLSIGLGKQKGADAMHEAGFGMLAERIPAVARVVLKSNNVLFGVGIIENARNETCRIEVVKGEEILDREPSLLDFAREQMPRIHFPETDVLVVGEIGKNLSGSGMDPNITGTWSTPFGGGGIRKRRTVVLDITDESHGNGIGLGMAEVTTMRAFDKIDFTATYLNSLTSTVIAPCVIPMVLETDEMAIRAAIRTCNGIDRSRVRVVFIRNTKQLAEILVSESMAEEARRTEGVDILEGPREVRFDREGNLAERL